MNAAQFVFTGRVSDIERRSPPAAIPLCAYGFSLTFRRTGVQPGAFRALSLQSGVPRSNSLRESELLADLPSPARAGWPYRLVLDSGKHALSRQSSDTRESVDATARQNADDFDTASPVCAPRPAEAAVPPVGNVVEWTCVAPGWMGREEYRPAEDSTGVLDNDDRISILDAISGVQRRRALCRVDS